MPVRACVCIYIGGLEGGGGLPMLSLGTLLCGAHIRDSLSVLLEYFTISIVIILMGRFRFCVRLWIL